MYKDPIYCMLMNQNYLFLSKVYIIVLFFI